MKSWLVLFLSFFLAIGNASADRIKDLTSVAAMRSNQLIGYGLVVGLPGTGDGADVSFTAQSMKTLLNRLGVSLEGALSDFETAASTGRVDIKNTAAVMVTVSAIGKASNLRGGTLLLTSLRGVDGEIYAISQGSLNATGIDATASAGSKVVIGVPTASRIPQGATVERIVENPFDKADRVILNVRDSDFTTTTAIVNSVNSRFGADVARAMDAVSISLQAPQDLTQRVAFMSMVENMDVMPGEPSARVVVNARTGTVVISRNVRVTAAAVSHGTISVSVAVTNEISQPGAFSNGVTAAVQNADVTVSEPNKPMFLFNPGVDLRQIVDAVNQVGATPSSLIAILEALKSAGSLRADLLVI